MRGEAGGDGSTEEGPQSRRGGVATAGRPARLPSLPDRISSLGIHPGLLETRFTSLPDPISSLGIRCGPLETRFTSSPGPIASLGIRSGPLETRSASRPARAALVAGGWASLVTCVSIYPPRDPMPVADDLWKQLVDEAGEAAVDSAAGISASEAERDLKAAGFDTNAERAKAEAAIAVLIGPGGAPAGAPPRHALAGAKLLSGRQVSFLDFSLIPEVARTAHGREARELGRDRCRSGGMRRSRGNL